MFPKDCYKIYVALKLHFSSKTYDYVKYNGKVKISDSAWEKRRDKYFFEKTLYKYRTRKNIEDFFISQFLYNKHEWIGNMLSTENDEIYKKHIDNKKFLTYNYTEDLKNILFFVEKNKLTFNKIFHGSNPFILQFIIQEMITYETGIILDEIYTWTKIKNKDIIEEEFVSKIQKYKSFLKINRNKYKTLTLELLAGEQNEQF